MGTERDDEERTMSEIIPWLPSGTNYQPSTRAVRDCSRLLSFEFFYPFFPSPNRFTIIKIIAKKFETILGILDRIFIYFILWYVVQLREEEGFLFVKNGCIMILLLLLLAPMDVPLMSPLMLPTAITPLINRLAAVFSENVVEIVICSRVVSTFFFYNWN